jgi:hypothetical protein
MSAGASVRVATLAAMPDVVTEETRTWGDLARSARISFEGAVVVRGPGARGIGDVLLRLGADRVIADQTQLGDPAMESARDDIVDAVILVHAWRHPSAIDEAARSAVAWVRPGGAVVLADLAVDRLRTASPAKYPSALLYRAHPELADEVERRCATSIQMATAGIRAGLDDKILIDFERPVGVYASPGEHQAAVDSGAWRGLEDLDPADHVSLVTAVGSLRVGTWPLVEREPWVVLCGRSRS